MSIHFAAKSLGGQVVSRQTILCPGPGHSRKDRSLSVTFDPNVPDGFLVHSHAHDDWQACRDHVRQALGLGEFKPDREGRDRRTYVAPEPRVIAADPAAVSRRDFAAAIFHEASPIGGTVVATYLASSRNVTLTAEAFTGEAIRFHPACPFRLGNGETARLPAMVAAMVNIETGEFQGIHRTALKGDGSGKAEVRGLDNPRKMLGSAAGACVKLCPEGAVTYGLGIGEGIETSLSVMGIGFRPVWSVLSAGTMAKFPVLAGVDCLTVFADNDRSGTGGAAAHECAARWSDEGREVFIVTPPMLKPDSTDWNDVAGKAVAA